MTEKERIDVLLTALGLAESRSMAQRLVMAGKVRVEGQVIHKPSRKVPRHASIEVASSPPYVSRGGEKLAAALAQFPVSVKDKVCADVGASTGGFTDCLLQNGAARVYAIDVGHGILHWRLRNDPRIVLMERTNARDVASLPELINLVTIDASFISLRLLMPVVRGWMSDRGDLLALIKPQFEAGREAVGKRGVIRDPHVHRAVVENVLETARSLDFIPQDILRSPLLGPKGNVEFVLWCKVGVPEADFELPPSLFIVE